MNQEVVRARNDLDIAGCGEFPPRGDGEESITT